MTELSKKIAEMDYDGLVTGIIPPVLVAGGILKALTGETVIKRGTLLVKEAGKLSAYAGTGVPDCILCDDTTVNTADVPTTVYIGGCFDPDKVILSSGTLTDEMKDTLRTKGIVFKAAN